MKLRVRCLAAALSVCWVAAAVHAQQTTSPAAVTVRDGVYTDEQAKRGATLYATICAHCHGKNLEGGADGSTPLAGPEFLAVWGNSTVGAIFGRVKVAMPDDDPGSVSDVDNVAILAYVLSVNKFPAGKTELPPDAAKLKLIKFERVKSRPQG
jgi:cytochrome c